MGVPVTYRGIILSSHEAKDKDRILKFLTKENGLLDIYAKGTGKLGSINAFISVPFMLCDLTVSDSHGYLYLRSGVIVESNSRIMNDLDAITAASHIGDILSEMSRQSDNSSEAYEIGVYSYYYLSSDVSRWKLITALFNWRVLSVMGYTVRYSVTNDTGSRIEDNGLYYLSTSGGDVYSGRKGDHGFCLMSGTSIAALNYISDCGLKDLFLMNCSESLTDKLFNFTLRYMSYQLEKNYLERFEL